MAKKVLSLILVLTMMVSLSCFALADADLQTLINNAVDNETFTLTSDVELETVLKVPSGKNIQIDLNGFSIINSDRTAIKNSGKLLIKDSVGGGVVKSTYENGVAVWNAKGSLQIEGGTYIADTAISNTKGTTTINDGTFTGSIAVNTTGDAASTTINSGKFNGEIRSANDEQTVINGGSFNDELADNYTDDEHSAVDVGGELQVTDNNSHEFDDGVIVPATCTENGSITKTCSVHGDIKVEVIPALGHDFSVALDDNATCENSGINHVQCSRCDEIKEVTVSANGHSTYTVDAKEPTCTEGGWEAYNQCVSCDYNDKVELDALGHALAHVERVEAAVGVAGNVEYWHCERCGANFSDAAAASAISDVTIPALVDFGGGFVGGGITGGTTTLEDEEVPLADLPMIFEDVAETDWFYDAVKYCFDSGLMKGVSDTTFEPSGVTNRQQIIVMLYRTAEAAGVDVSVGEDTNILSFNDAFDISDWAIPAMQWACGVGLVKGDDAGNVNPLGSITREQLALMLYRYEQIVNNGGFTGDWMFLLDFADADQISSWADEAMHWVVMNKIMGGKDDGTLDPQGNAKRCEVAAMFMRFIER